MSARRRALLPALFALLLMAPSSALAQEKRKEITGEGTHGFRALLRAKGLQPLENKEQFDKADPKRVIVVSFRGADVDGTRFPDVLPDLIDPKRIVDAGGALFVATDQPIDAGWNGAFGAEIADDNGAAAIVYYAGRRASYQSRPECPFATGYIGAVPQLFSKSFRDPDTGELTSSSLHVATNKPSYLLKPKNDLERLGGFPTDFWRIGGRLRPGPLDFAQGHRYDSGGKFLILADHSVFINSMLLPRNSVNDNLAFASNCVDWLIQGPDYTRAYVLFVEDGRIWQKDDYNLYLQSLPPPNPEDVAQFLWENRDLLWKNTDLAEEILSNLEDSDIFGEVERSGLIGDALDNLLDTWMVVRFVLIAGALFLLGYGAMSFMGSRYKFPKRVPRLSLLLDRMRPRSGLLDLRLRSGLGRGQYYELARQRARDMFAELKMTPAEEGPLPQVEIDAGWWHRGTILRDLQQVWRVAFGATPMAIRGKQWEPWMKKMHRIEKMLREGTIRFQ